MRVLTMYSNMSRAMKHDMKNIAMGIANIQISKQMTTLSYKLY